MSKFIHSLNIYFILEHLHLIFIVFVVWYKINEIKLNKKNAKFFENIIKYENNNLFAVKEKSIEKSLEKFVIFKYADKEILFNFENEAKNIIGQMKNILSVDQVNVKMNFKYQLIVNDILQTKFEIIFKTQKEKLKLSFDLYITSEDLILKRATITKNELLNENLKFLLPEITHLSFI